MKKLLLLLLTALTLPVASADEAKKDKPAPPKPPEPVKPATDKKPSPEKKMETITLGAGCFWCTEVILQRVNGVQSVVSGYSNGQTKNPTYKQVCTGETGHAEVVQVVYDPAVLPTEKLLHVFFELHDPTTLNRQGHDSGTQYRSGIYYHTDEQKAVAEKVKAEVDKSGKFKSPIVTEIVKVDNWSKGEDYHQNYFNENYTQGTGNWGYCNATIIPKLKKMGLLKPEEKKIAEDQ
jgi:peptide-methionine (S)-S-oxide reductase